MNIFIAGLNYNMSEAELGELFAEYGEVVSVKIIMDRETGRSKGYGFVEMADDEAGDKAIAALNEVDMDGKTLSVSVARPREERPRRSYGNNGGGGYRGGNNSRGGGYGGSRGDNGYGGGRIRKANAFMKDPRNELFNYYFNVIQRLEPEYFIFENVAGIYRLSSNFLHLSA